MQYCVKNNKKKQKTKKKTKTKKQQQQTNNKQTKKQTNKKQQQQQKKQTKKKKKKNKKKKTAIFRECMSEILPKFLQLTQKFCRNPVQTYNVRLLKMSKGCNIAWQQECPLSEICRGAQV